MSFFFLINNSLKTERRSVPGGGAERLPLTFPEDVVYLEFLSNNARLKCSTKKTQPTLLVSSFKVVSAIKIIRRGSRFVCWLPVYLIGRFSRRGCSDSIRERQLTSTSQQSTLNQATDFRSRSGRSGRSFDLVM